MNISNHRLIGDGINFVDSPSHSGLFDPGLPDTIIIHFTAGSSAESSVNALCNPKTKASAHLVVGRDVSGKGVQNGLLKIVEGQENRVGDAGLMLSTKNVLFIASGAFEGVERVVENRLRRQKVEQKRNWKSYLSTEDLVDYGMERQLMGRFPVKVVYDQLTSRNLFDIMKTCKKSPLHSYQSDFKAWDIDLQIEDDALSEIARFAEVEGTGARGLTGILNKVLLEEMYTLPGSYQGELKIGKDYVTRRLQNE